MTTTVLVDTSVEEEPPPSRGFSLPGSPMLWMAIAGLLAMSIARIVSDNDDLTSDGTFGVALRTAAPIALAGLGGLYSERCGVVNIGLEGMMIMGTVVAGWWAWEFGPWMGLLGGILGGCIGGALHAVATVTFGVNHIVSGFAINIIAPGVARFMATLLFEGEEGGSITNSPGNKGQMGVLTMPFTSGGKLFSWGTPDPLGRIASWGWFGVSDLAGFLKAMTFEVRFDVALMVVLFVASAYVLWRTPLGLRLRSAGEHPSAANSLGVSVALYRYIGVIISGGFAGFGGAVLVLNTGYSQGQTGGRGYLGLAALIVGNWRPAGVAAGAGLFGFFDGITQRLDPDQIVIALILAGGLLMAAVAAYSALTASKGPRLSVPLLFAAAAGGVLTVLLTVGIVNADGSGMKIVYGIALAACVAAIGGLLYGASRVDATAVAIFALAGAAALAAYVKIDSIPDEFVLASPFIVTLIVVAARGQASRAPARVGIPWRKGDD